MDSSSRVSRERLVAHLAGPGYQPAKMKELARDLGVPQESYRDFRRLVKELEREGRLLCLRHNRYALPGVRDLVVGKLRVHPRGFGFVVAPDAPADLYIPRAGMAQAVDGDMVRAEVTGRGDDEDGRGLEGRILEVVAPAERTFVGTVERRGSGLAVAVDDPSVPRDIHLDGPLPDGLGQGYRVLVRITERGWGHDGLRGQVEEVLGRADEPRLDFLSVVKRFDLPLEMPAAVQQEEAELRLDVAAEMPRRRDLRDLRCFTIDPVEARDFDDAVSVETVADGYRLGVHIADVSHFVGPGTALDREAFQRGTSVYLLDQVVHMLPTSLAAGLCTLAPEAERLAVSVLVDLDRRGHVRQYEIVESVIRSVARLTYQQVQAAFDGVAAAAGAAAGLGDELEAMRRLARLRHRIRQVRGALDFDLPEPRVELDSLARPVSLGRYPRLESHRLVEEFMLVANECVGERAAQLRLPVLYRVHRPPHAGKLAAVAQIVPDFHVPSDANVHPADVQRLLARVVDRPDGQLVQRLLLQALRRAEYAVEDAGHFGLACRRYVHFTSPIRRYPDLLVHRVLKAHLHGQLTPSYRDDLERGMGWMARWTSQSEQRAEEAERMYVRIKQLRYMEEFVGREFDGRVSGVLRGGFFVELAELLVEGFCFVGSLGDYFDYDERRLRLVGRRTRRLVQLGMPVRVRIAGVDWKAQKMDMALVGQPARPRSRRHARR